MNSGNWSTNRNKFYQQNAWKEAEAKALWLELMEHLAVSSTEITEKFEQISRGDYRYEDGTYAELKGQNIGQYQKNVIEVGEYNTGTSYHSDGHRSLSDWLNTYGINLADCWIYERTGTKETQKFGNPHTFNMGFGPVLNGADAWYINRTSTLIYLYKPETLLRFIRSEIDNGRLYWMGGRANDITLAVFVPNSPVAWQKVNGKWEFVGSPELEQQALDYLEGKQK